SVTWSASAASPSPVSEPGRPPPRRIALAEAAITYTPSAMPMITMAIVPKWVAATVSLAVLPRSSLPSGVVSDTVRTLEPAAATRTGILIVLCCPVSTVTGLENFPITTPLPLGVTRSRTLTGCPRWLLMETGTSPDLPPSVTRNGSTMMTCCCWSVTLAATLRSSCLAVRRPPGLVLHADDCTAAMALLRYRGSGPTRMLRSSPIWSSTRCTWRRKDAVSSVRLTCFSGGFSLGTWWAGGLAAARLDRLAGRSQGGGTLSASRPGARAGAGFPGRVRGGGGGADPGRGGGGCRGCDQGGLGQDPLLPRERGGGRGRLCPAGSGRGPGKAARWGGQDLRDAVVGDQDVHLAVDAVRGR